MIVLITSEGIVGFDKPTSEEMDQIYDCIINPKVRNAYIEIDGKELDIKYLKTQVL